MKPRSISYLFNILVAVLMVFGTVTTGLGPVSAMSGDASSSALLLADTIESTPVTLDGTVHSNVVASGSSISIDHTTGTGANRLLLVGVSWNSGTSERTISSITFTPSGGSAVGLNMVVSRKYSSQNRDSAIYSLLNPASGQAGTITVTFSGSVGSGIMAGAANFAGVDQSTPFGTTNSAEAQSTAPSVTLTGLNGDELIFDNVFQGASASTQTLTAGSGQTQLWNPDYVANLRAAASTEQATTSSVTMSWTAASSTYWVIVAVPIHPANSGPTYDLTIGSTGSGSGTVNPSVGSHTYPEDTVVPLQATAAAGSTFDGWTGDPDCADGSVTMSADKTCTANFTAIEYTLSITSAHGTVAKNPNQSTYHYMDVVQLTANPVSPYIFTGWSGDLTGSANPGSVTMDGNKSITANYMDATGLVISDGIASSGKANPNSSSISFSATTGVGANRLMLVGVSWNCGSTNRTISRPLSLQMGDQR